MFRFVPLFLTLFICQMPVGLAQDRSTQQKRSKQQKHDHQHEQKKHQRSKPERSNHEQNNQETPIFQEDSIKTLKSVEIVAKLLAPSITPVQKLEKDAIQQLSSSSVADAIRYFSGIQVKDYGGIGGLKTVNIRSMGSDQLGVFYDGIQLGNAQNGQIDLGKFSMENLEAVNLYNGQKADFLQSAKDYNTASALYLKTTQPNLTAEDSRLLKFGFKTGSFGLMNPSLLWHERVNAKLQTSFSAEATKAHGRYPFTYKKVKDDGTLANDTTAIRKNGDIEGLRVEAKAYGEIPNGGWEFQTYSYFSERGLPGSIANNVFERAERQWDQNLFLQGAFHKRISAVYSLSIKAKAARDYTRYEDKGFASLNLENHYTQKDVYVSIANAFQINKHWNWDIATDYQRTNLTASLRDFMIPKRQSALAAIATSYRLEHLQITSSLLALYVTDLTLKNDSTNRHHAFTPTFAISGNPFANKDITLSAFYKKNYRIPTFNELYYTLLGTVRLEPERTTQYNASVQYLHHFSGNHIKQLSIHSNVYYNNIRNKIISIPAGVFRWMNLNLGEVDIKGFDISTVADWQLKDQLHVKMQVSYTFQDARDKTSSQDSYYNHQIPYTPKHSGTIVLQTDYKDWHFIYSYIYTGERYHQKENAPVNHLEPWYTSDVAFAKKLRIKNTAYRFGIELNNIFSQYFDIVKNYPMPGRNFKINCSIAL